MSTSGIQLPRPVQNLAASIAAHLRASWPHAGAPIFVLWRTPEHLIGPDRIERLRAPRRQLEMF